MYSTCLHCTHPLGANARVEAFPVGRRLAFDAARGRLWVVCTRCGRWNLTPLEERWEAIEQAERLYRDTRLRASTGEIGLARVPDAGGESVDLVRVGRPLLPEMAAWRYGDRFAGRRRRQLVRGGLLTGVAGLGVAAARYFGIQGPMIPPEVLVHLGMMGFMVSAAGGLQGLRQGALTARWVPDGAGQFLLVPPNALQSVRLAAASEAEGGLALKVPYQLRRERTSSFALSATSNSFPDHEAILAGEPARAALRQLLPVANGTGASPAGVRDAVRVLESLGPAERALTEAARRLPQWAARQTLGDTGALVHLPADARLALEMAVHEEQERRALEGELAELTRAWHDAEAIAGIADALALPRAVETRYAALRDARDEGARADAEPPRDGASD